MNGYPQNPYHMVLTHFAITSSPVYIPFTSDRMTDFIDDKGYELSLLNKGFNLFKLDNEKTLTIDEYLSKPNNVPKLRTYYLNGVKHINFDYIKIQSIAQNDIKDHGEKLYNTLKNLDLKKVQEYSMYRGLPTRTMKKIYDTLSEYYYDEEGVCTGEPKNNKKSVLKKISQFISKVLYKKITQGDPTFFVDNFRICDENSNFYIEIVSRIKKDSNEKLSLNDNDKENDYSCKYLHTFWYVANNLMRPNVQEPNNDEHVIYLPFKNENVTYIDYINSNLLFKGNFNFIKIHQRHYTKDEINTIINSRKSEQSIKINKDSDLVSKVLTLINSMKTTLTQLNSVK